MTETVEEYRLYKYKLTHPEDGTLDDGTQCPACMYSKVSILSYVLVLYVRVIVLSIIVIFGH